MKHNTSHHAASFACAPHREFGRKDRNSGNDISQIASDLKKATDDVMAFGDTVKNRLNEDRLRLDALEQKSARQGYNGPQVLPTAGRQFIEADEIKAFTGDRVTAGRRIGVQVKAIISSLTTDADGSAGDLLTPYRDDTVLMPRRRMVVRDLLTVIPITSGSVQYPKMTGFTNSAATISETAGTEKAQSEMKFDLATANVTTIAHWIYAMRQILDDAPQLMGLIDGELRYGLAYVEDNQLLNGGGTGSDLNGIYTQATAYAAPMTPTEAGNLNKIDVIGLALLQQSLTNLPADGVVLHPSDWLDMRLTKDSEGRYIMGDPQTPAPASLFGVPVVLTEAMTIDKFMVGAFKQCATLYDRMNARVEVSTEDGDNFRKNKVTVLAEERVALAVKNTSGFTKGDFSEALAA